MIKKWIPIWVFPVLIVMAIGTVYLRLSVVRTTYRISQEDKKIRDAQKSRERANLKLASLRSPRRLEPLAKTKFGLSQPKADQVVYLK